MKATDAERQRTLETIETLGPWSQNVHLPIGVSTAPAHPRGDWPRAMWLSFQGEIPTDLEGKTVLDIGCNAGFYSFEMAMRGAEVVGIDPDPHFLRQARWLRKKLNLQSCLRFRQSQVYNLAQYDRDFDIVLMMGVLHRLRYPLLGLDIAVEKAKETVVFQSLMAPTPTVQPRPPLTPNGIATEEDMMQLNGAWWPNLSFVEGALAGDPGVWWVPSASGVQALLRSSGLKIRRRMGGSIFICDVSPGDAAIQTRGRAELLGATGRSWRHADARGLPRGGAIEAMTAQ